MITINIKLHAEVHDGATIIQNSSLTPGKQCDMNHFVVLLLLFCCCFVVTLAGFMFRVDLLMLIVIIVQIHMLILDICVSDSFSGSHYFCAQCLKSPSEGLFKYLYLTWKRLTEIKIYFPGASWPR